MPFSFFINPKTFRLSSSAQMVDERKFYEASILFQHTVLLNVSALLPCQMN